MGSILNDKIYNLLTSQISISVLETHFLALLLQKDSNLSWESNIYLIFLVDSTDILKYLF